MDAGRMKNGFQHRLFEVVFPALAFLSRAFLGDQVPAERFGNDMLLAKLLIVGVSVSIIATISTAPFGGRRTAGSRFLISNVYAMETSNEPRVMSAKN
jgi:hypothetical protein